MFSNETALMTNPYAYDQLFVIDPSKPEKSTKIANKDFDFKEAFTI